MVSHLDRYNLVCSSQHGFRRGRSCGTNLLIFLEYVTKQLDGGVPVDAIFLDFAKAFDRVPHARLLDKIRAHGIGGRVADWIASWLRGRRQRVCVRGRRSGWRPMLSGVPQGSVLGPLLFIIFANDLETGVTSQVLKFADDTKMFCKVINETDGRQLQRDLDVLGEWAQRWHMQFNVAKCKVMHFGYGGINCDYFMGNQRLEVIHSERDLGVITSSSLKVGEQCQQAYARANKMLGLVSRVIRHRDPALLLRLYKSLVRPHLEYAVSSWSPHYVKDKALLERVQHRFTRLFENLRELEYQDRLTALNLWSLEERRNRADLIEVFKMAHGHTNVALEEFFRLAESGSTRGHTLKLLKGQCKRDIRLHFFSHRVVNRWNQLPQEAVSACSVNVFKNKLDKLRKHQMGFFMDLGSA